jgi:hypothetical protein
MANTDIFARVIVNEDPVKATVVVPQIVATINDPSSKVVINNDSSVAVFRYVSFTPSSFSVGLTAQNNIFSVSNSPVTSQGVIDLSFISQGQNTFLAASSTKNSVPDFRKITQADLPDLSGTYLTSVSRNGTLTGYGTTASPLQVVTGGSVGTVNSVAITSTDFTISGSPITNSGTIIANIATTGVSSGTYGSATQVPIITVNAKGQVTDATTTSISIPTQGLTSVGILSASLTVTNSPRTTDGNITLETAPTGVTTGVYGSNSSIPQITIGPDGRITSAVNLSVGTPGSGIGTVTSVGLVSSTLSVTSTPITSNGFLAVDLSSSGVIAGTYGNSFNIPIVTVNSFGQITSVSTSEISPLPAGGLTSQVLTYNNEDEQAWVYSDGGTW